MVDSINHILVVDDDDRIRGLLKDYLEDNNYIVSTAENAEEAKNKLEYFKFDLIILDVMMPGQNGYDLTKDIKKKMKIPIILLTAKGAKERSLVIKEKVSLELLVKTQPWMLWDFLSKERTILPDRAKQTEETNKERRMRIEVFIMWEK